MFDITYTDGIPYFPLNPLFFWMGLIYQHLDIKSPAEAGLFYLHETPSGHLGDPVYCYRLESGSEPEISEDIHCRDYDTQHKKKRVSGCGVGGDFNQISNYPTYLSDQHHIKEDALTIGPLDESKDQADSECSKDKTQPIDQRQGCWIDAGVL